MKLFPYGCSIDCPHLEMSIDHLYNIVEPFEEAGTYKCRKFGSVADIHNYGAEIHHADLCGKCDKYSEA